MLLELIELQKSKSWKGFRYLTENQSAYDDAPAPLMLDISFDKLTITADPHMHSLTFQGACGWMQIVCVRSVACKPSILGDIITAHCSDGSRHTMIAQI